MQKGFRYTVPFVVVALALAPFIGPSAMFIAVAALPVAIRLEIQEWRRRKAAVAEQRP